MFAFIWIFSLSAKDVDKSLSSSPIGPSSALFAVSNAPDMRVHTHMLWTASSPTCVCMGIRDIISDPWCYTSHMLNSSPPLIIKHICIHLCTQPAEQHMILFCYARHHASKAHRTYVTNAYRCFTQIAVACNVFTHATTNHAITNHVEYKYHGYLACNVFTHATTKRATPNHAEYKYHGYWPNILHVKRVNAQRNVWEHVLFKELPQESKHVWL